MPTHSDTLTINCLESTAYYQKSCPLDEYIDKFQDLVADSGYSNPETIVVKFQRGLSARIQNTITTMASRRPSGTSMDAWYAAAQVIDQNRAANKAFTSTYQASTTRPVHTHLHLSPGNPIPMDLDTARNAPVAPRCFQCKLPGHLVATA